MTKSKIVIQDKKGKRIAGVKLINGGMKGIEVSYETVEIQDGMSYCNEHNDKRHRPVHRDLKNLIQQLKPFILDLCGYPIKDEDWRDALLMTTEVTGIKAGTDKFVITGKMESWEDKTIALSSPLIKEADAYSEYEEVMDLVDSIYREADLYMQGIKRAKREEVIVDFMKEVKKNESFTMETFESMTPEEQAELMTELEDELGMKVTEEDGQKVLVTSEGTEQESQDEEVEVPNFIDLDLDELPA